MNKCCTKNRYVLTPALESLLLAQRISPARHKQENKCRILHDHVFTTECSIDTDVQNRKRNQTTFYSITSLSISDMSLDESEYSMPITSAMLGLRLRTATRSESDAVTCRKAQASQPANQRYTGTNPTFTFRVFL